MKCRPIAILEMFDQSSCTKNLPETEALFLISRVTPVASSINLCNHNQLVIHHYPKKLNISQIYELGRFGTRYVLICMTPSRGPKMGVFSANSGTKLCDLVQNFSNFSVWEGSGAQAAGAETAFVVRLRPK